MSDFAPVENVRLMEENPEDEKLVRNEVSTPNEDSPPIAPSAYTYQFRFIFPYVDTN